MTLIHVIGRDGNKIAINIDDISSIFSYDIKYTKIWKRSGGYIEILESYDEVVKKIEEACIREKGRQSIWKR